MLSREKFRKYVTEPERKEFLIALARESELIEIFEAVAVCRDPGDDKFLELAVCGGADCLETGDPDLLVLNPFRGVPILPPVSFVAKF